MKISVKNLANKSMMIITACVIAFEMSGDGIAFLRARWRITGNGAEQNATYQRLTITEIILGLLSCLALSISHK